MGYKVFVSYKYADSNVKSLGYSWQASTVRDYVDRFQSQLQSRGSSIYKGERDGEDLSYLSEATIWSKLKDRIYDSSITVLFISPGMREMYKSDKNQWIPWEIAFSIREQTRNDRTSHSNAVVAVVLPDRNGSTYYYNNMTHFDIVRNNINNGYIEVVGWDDFMSDTTRYFNAAIRRKNNTPSYKVVKTV